MGRDTIAQTLKNIELTFTAIKERGPIKHATLDVDHFADLMMNRIIRDGHHPAVVERATADRCHRDARVWSCQLMN